MARYRVNLPDAIDTRANRIARAHTALVRIGTVKLINADNTVNVEIGGSIFPAVAIGTYSVNDVVVVLADTDAWWVIGKAGPDPVIPPPSPVYATVNTARFGGFGLSTASTSFIDVGNSTSLSFTKQSSTTRLRLAGALSFYSTISGQGIEIGALVNGTDYPIGRLYGIVPLNVRLNTSGSVTTPAGIPAGAHTIPLRWRAQNTSGNITMDTGDFAFIEVQEVP